MDDKAKMTELVGKLNDYAYRYYVLDDPIVADNVYDGLYDELAALEKSTGIVLPDSPTQKVGGDTIKAFEPHTHINKLYSLDKCNNFDELRAWHEKVVKAVGEVSYVLEYKLDGLTACLTYENGLLKSASTRGNGVTGENVTAQIKTIKSIPLKIAYEGLLEVKGECIMRRSVFEKYNKTASEPLKNPRNAAAGAIRNLNPKITATRNLDLILYDINYIDNKEVMSQESGLNFLKNNNFKTESVTITSDISIIIDKIGSIDREKLDFETDGMVIKVNDFAQRERLGFTDKFPKWAIAYKFEAEETTTTVNDVIWQVGRTGKLTPLAFVEPVELCGATIKRATLNNYSDILRKKVKIGSTVFIRRSNDVIPEILSAADGGEGRDIEKPTSCPACGAVVFEEGAHIFCSDSENCPPQIVARLEHFASKDCMDIEGLSEKTIWQFYNAFGIKQPYELYDLTESMLLNLDGFKDKKAANIIGSVEKSKDVSLSAFINALSIPNVGKVLAGDLAKIYGDITALSRATAEELSCIDDIGGIVAGDIRKFFDEKYYVVENLLKRGVHPRAEAVKTGALSGKKFVLTGTMSYMPRSAAAKLIEDNGGTVQSSVTKETDIVVAGENAGSKLDKAKAQGITVIGEAEFLSLFE